MQGENLAEAVGSILSVERSRAQLSQAQLADRAGISQQWLSRLERGAVNSSFATIQKVFAVLGRQLRVEAVPLQIDVDIDMGLALTDAERAREIEVHSSLLQLFNGVPFAVSGRLAALAQGAPTVSPTWIDIVVASKDLDAFAASMEKSFSMRWSAKWDDWGYGSTDPREPGVPRWRIRLSDMRLHIVDELPTTVEVRVGERLLRVVPIAEIERADPWLHRLMTRWRERRESNR